MTNKQWIKTLDEFERAVVCVNFVRSIPQHLHENKKIVRTQYEKWLEQQVNKEKTIFSR